MVDTVATLLTHTTNSLEVSDALALSSNSKVHVVICVLPLGIHLFFSLHILFGILFWSCLAPLLYLPSALMLVAL